MLAFREHGFCNTVDTGAAEVHSSTKSSLLNIHQMFNNVDCGLQQQVNSCFTMCFLCCGMSSSGYLLFKKNKNKPARI